MNFLSTLAIGGALSVLAACATLPSTMANPYASLAKIGTVDERFQSYNVEMVEVTGGRFWAPYGGAEGEMYRMRPPAELTDKRLVALTRHLGPAYVRVSGTWANSTYLPAEGEIITEPPAGYKQILTRDQWRGVINFAQAVDAKILTSFAVSAGARDANGVWQTEQADRMFDLTAESGGSIAAVEFINEPNAAIMGGLPTGYNAQDYTRDFRIMRDWIKSKSPSTRIVGPSSVGEGAFQDGIPVALPGGIILTKDIMAANPNVLDVVSYHFYGDVSQRCAAARPKTANKAEALSPRWLDLTLRDWTYYSGLRDQYEPGDSIWVTETAQAACGGSQWAAEFIDSFRYVNQLGLLAQKQVQVVFHNTLSASDYSLIDEHTMTPRPNYWAAVLWARTMGTTVLAPPPSPSPEVRLYAHCLKGVRGGVGLLAMNIGEADAALPVGENATLWHITGAALDSRTIAINGIEPSLASDGHLHGLDGVPTSAMVNLTGHSIAFIALPTASNSTCI